MERFLQNLSLSVIAALVASILARGGLREAASVAAAILAMVVLRKAIWAMAAGMVVAAGWTFLAA
jgi:branched-subunit amino acid transport protein